MIHFNEGLKRTEVKNTAKNILIEEFKEFLNKCHPDSYSQVKSGEFSVAIGDMQGKEVCVNVSFTAKNFESYISNGKSKTEYEAYCRKDEEEKYLASLANKKK